MAEEDEVEKQVEKQEDKHEGKHEDAVETAEKETAAVEQELEAQLEEDGAGGDDAGEKEPEAVTANTTSRRGRALAADDKETDAPSSSTVEAASAASEMPADCDGSTEDEEDAAAFESWTAAKLKAECRRRKLAVWGSKAKLCARLRAAPEPAAEPAAAADTNSGPKPLAITAAAAAAATAAAAAAVVVVGNDEFDEFEDGSVYFSLADLPPGVAGQPAPGTDEIPIPAKRSRMPVQTFQAGPASGKLLGGTSLSRWSHCVP